MKKTLLGFFALILTFNCSILTASAKTASEGTSSSASGAVGEQSSSSGCIWNTSTNTLKPKAYMIDLAVRTKEDAKEGRAFTVIASAIVGNNVEGNSKYKYAKSRRAKKANGDPQLVRINATGEIKKVTSITDLETLVKYMNYHGSVSGIGTQLSDDAVQNMIIELGVGKRNKDGEFEIKDDFTKYFQEEQSKKITATYGYRILIQEYHHYKTTCTSSSTSDVYLLRKESEDARTWTNGGGGKKEELQIKKTILGITKYTGSTPWKAKNISSKTNGAGYNVLWMNMDEVLPPGYDCEQIDDTDQCQIIDSEDNSVKATVKCNGQTTYKIDGNTETLDTACPAVTWECEEDEDYYGRCNILKKVDDDVVSTITTDCNNTEGTDGKTSYDGITLSKGKECPFKPKWNYDIDAVCENCDSNTTGGSYLVQDVVDWKAVLHSTERTDNNTLKNYYKKASGILCKESFNVVFPNKNTVKNIRINAGRYFTVNEKGPTYINGVYNFEPIKVTRTRQCISTNTDASKAKTALTTYSNNNKVTELGTISLKYTEKYSASKYNTTQTLIADTSRVKNYDKQFSTTTVADKTYQILTDTTSGYFTLENSNLYRYISKQNGLSQSVKPADTSKYTDVGKPNLPISLNNDQGATIGLYYTLPTNSKLAAAVNKNEADYLEKSPTYDNVYQSGINSSETACAKMYGTSGSKYTSCVNARNSSKTADVTEANKCLEQLGPNIKSSAKYQYQCEIKSDTDDDKCQDKCYIIASSTIGKKYVCKDGQICDEATYIQDCVDTCGGRKCVYYDHKYYGQNGDEVTLEEYKMQCPDNKETTNCELECTECGYCCQDTTMMCAVKDEDGDCSCPEKGTGNTIIYRPIDLTNPFPGQTNYGRATGANWCARLSTGKTICKNTNSVVTRDITNNRSTANESVYSKEPLYEVDLDATAIKKIRKYNNGKEYDDFTLTCDKYSCYSKFLRDNNPGFKVTGECANKTGIDALKCAESG